jgi:predicted N-formylglutamate amidohydrolase
VGAVPPDLAPLFAGWRDILDSHRGFDLGALATAEALGRGTGAPVVATTVSRMVVDCNRSLGHPGLFSEITKKLPRSGRTAILEAYYHPHRQAVTMAVAGLLEAGRTVLHLACHSFTPRLGGITRHCDVGLLYNPGRMAEKAFCLAWLEEMSSLDGERILRRNYPYRGVADGLTTSLRRRFGEGYLGVELEVNQRFAWGGEASLEVLNDLLLTALRRVWLR